MLHGFRHIRVDSQELIGAGMVSRLEITTKHNYYLRFQVFWHTVPTQSWRPNVRWIERFIQKFAFAFVSKYLSDRSHEICPLSLCYVPGNYGARSPIR